MNDNCAVASVVLHLKIDGEYLAVLKIPKRSIPSYALKPYKWLWFLGYIIYGSTVLGTTSGSEDGEGFSDDLMNSENLQHDDIYYASSGQYRLVDPTTLSEATSSSATSSGFQSTTSSLRSMNEAVRQRDDRGCVLTGHPDQAEVCHLIPRSLGHLYIAHITRKDGDIANVEDADTEITDIDDIKNQITLNPSAHRTFDAMQLAFLLTPNGLLERRDIPQPQPSRAPSNSSDRNLTRPDDNTFLTVHYFSPEDDEPAAKEPGLAPPGFLTIWTPHNADIWQPLGTAKNDWPTRTIFNYVYARTVLKRWSHPQNSGYVEKARVKYVEIASAMDVERKRKAEDERVNGRQPGRKAGNADDDDDDLLPSSMLNAGMGPSEMLWWCVWARKMERGDPTPMPSCRDVKAEKRIKAWRDDVSNA